MSKVAIYIQGHVSGEVYTRSDVRDMYASDGGVLEKKPEMVIRPRTVNDIRKVLKFTTQLAEKGHALSVCARGSATSTTGSSLGQHVAIDMAHYLDKIYEYDAKQKLIHVQAGVEIEQLNKALALAGVKVYGTDAATYGTIGGYIAEGTSDSLDSTYETTRDAIQQLEIILPGGDVVQTGRISKRELDKKKGLQGAEGDLYREIDAAIEDNAELIETMRNTPVVDMASYPGIVDVKQKNGSFDLTPLLIGSQGSLAVTAEAIVKTEFITKKGAYMIVGFGKHEAAHDTLDVLRSLNPTTLEYYSAELISAAKKDGRSLAWYNEFEKTLDTCVSYALVAWQDFNEKNCEKQRKKAVKKLTDVKNVAVHAPENEFSVDEIYQIRSLATVAQQSANSTTGNAPAISDGFYIPVEQFENFTKALADVEESLHLTIPLYGSALSNIYRVAPQLSLQKVGDKQKILKLIAKLMAIVEAHNGIYHAKSGMGRLTSRFVYESLGDEVKAMNNAIKKAFDPHGILNDGVKQDFDARTLVSMLRSQNSI